MLRGHWKKKKQTRVPASARRELYEVVKTRSLEVFFLEESAVFATVVDGRVILLLNFQKLPQDLI